MHYQDINEDTRESNMTDAKLVFFSSSFTVLSLIIPPLHCPRGLYAMQQQGIKHDTGVTTMTEIKAIFDEVSAKLGEGKKYLVGETLTAADIVFASLAAFSLGQPFASYKGVPSGAP